MSLFEAWISAGDWHLWICKIVEPSFLFLVRPCVVRYWRGCRHAHSFGVAYVPQETQRKLKTTTTSLLQQHRSCQSKWKRGMTQKLELNTSLHSTTTVFPEKYDDCFDNELHEANNNKVSFPAFRGQCMKRGFPKVHQSTSLFIWISVVVNRSVYLNTVQCFFLFSTGRVWLWWDWRGADDKKITWEGLLYSPRKTRPANICDHSSRM